MAGRMGVARARLDATRRVLENIFVVLRLRCAAGVVCNMLRKSIACSARWTLNSISLYVVGDFVG